MTKRISFILTLALLPWNAFAWGTLGHRAAALVAEAKLSPAARQAVARLLHGDSLADVAAWADSLRSTGRYPQTNWYHFEKIPDGKSFLENLRALPEWQRQKGGVVAAILLASETLRSRSASRGEKGVALKFLVHFVGDIHQPLHSGRPEDKGGVTLATDWFGTPMSLHKIWDSGMILSGHAALFRDGMRIAERARAYADDLRARLDGGRAPNLTPDVGVWLDESLRLRGPAYDLTYETDPGQYQATHLPTVDARIHLAGVRLADLLNRIFAGASASPEEKELRRRIEEIVGDIRGVISFRR